MLDPFYPIVDSAGWLARLLPCGVKLTQLRVKSADKGQIAQEIVKARNLCAEYGAQLVVNDHWKEAMDAGCDFVHLGQEDLDDVDIEALRGAGIRYGVTTRDHQELDRALSVEPHYIAFGPIYESAVMDTPFAPQGLVRLAEWRELTNGLPLVAVGGLTLDRAHDALEAGADCVAVISDVLAAQDPEARVHDYIQATRKFA